MKIRFCLTASIENLNKEVIDKVLLLIINETHTFEK